MLKIGSLVFSHLSILGYILALIFILAISAFPYVFADEGHFTEAGTQAFIQRCQTQCSSQLPTQLSKICQSVCQCSFQKIQQNMTYAEFEQASQSKNTMAFNNAVNQCINEAFK